MPFKGGGEVATQLVGKHVDSTVNNPIEAVAQWRAGTLRPLCVFDPKRMPYKDKVTEDDVLGRHSDLQGAGPRRRLPDAARHLHAAPGVTPGPGRSTTSTSSRRCMATPEWKKLMEEGAFNTTALMRQGVRRLGGEGRAAAHHADEGSRLPRRSKTARAPDAQARRRGPPARSSAERRDRSVAALFLAVGALVIYDSVRLGASAGRDDGPEPGYFPFYIGLIMLRLRRS